MAEQAPPRFGAGHVMPSDAVLLAFACHAKPRLRLRLLLPVAPRPIHRPCHPSSPLLPCKSPAADDPQIAHLRQLMPHVHTA